MALREEIIYTYKMAVTPQFEVNPEQATNCASVSIDRVIESRREHLHFAPIKTSFPESTDTEKEEEKEQQVRLEARYSRLHGRERELESIAENKHIIDALTRHFEN